jgi:mannose-1-phosphate guanylyltransferase/MurNAc alpha-1-phosphate uridylyltransferase
VNLHHGAAAIRAHLESTAPPGTVHLSEEAPEALGTAGALGQLRGWLDGRDALVVNADGWAPGPLTSFVDRWDRDRPSVLVHESDRFGPVSVVVASLLPWSELERLEPVPSGLYEVVWRRCAAAGGLDVVRHDGPFVDCGTPTDYLAANLEAAVLAGGTVIDSSAHVDGEVVGPCVIGAGAQIDGRIEASVVWPGVRIGPDQTLRRVIAAAADLIVGPLPPAGPRS